MMQLISIKSTDVLFFCSCPTTYMYDRVISIYFILNNYFVQIFCELKFRSMELHNIFK